MTFVFSQLAATYNYS